MVVFWTVLAYLFSLLSLILNITLFINLKPPQNFYFIMFQLAAAALSPFLAVLGAIGLVLGWIFHAPVAFIAGILGAAISIVYIDDGDFSTPRL